MPKTEVHLRGDLELFQRAAETAAGSGQPVDQAAVARIVGSLSRLLDQWTQLDDHQRWRVAETLTHVAAQDDVGGDPLSPARLIDAEARVYDLEEEIGF